MRKKVLFVLLSSLLLVSCDSSLFESVVTEQADNSFTDTDKKDDSTKTYKIKFVNFDDTILDEKKVKRNEVPTTDIKPTKESDEQYHYNFKSWNPAPYAANKDQVYKATYSSELRKYSIKFYNNDGSQLLDNQTVEYGSKPKFKLQPDNGNLKHVGYSKEKGSNIVTIFSDDDLQEVTKDEDYYAVYSSTNQTFKLTFYLTEKAGSGPTGTIKYIENLSLNTIVDLKNYPDIVPSCTTFFNQKDLKTYVFKDWHNGYLSESKMLGKESIDPNKIGLKPVTANSIYYPIFEAVSMQTAYPNGYLSGKLKNSNKLEIFSFDDAVSSGKIEVEDKTLSSFSGSLNDRYDSLYLALSPSIEAIKPDGFSNIHNTISYISKDNVKLLDNRSFSFCENLMYDFQYQLTLPSKLETIGSYVFSNTNISVFAYEGTSLSTIKENAFNNTKKNQLQLRLSNMTKNSFNNISLENGWWGNNTVTVTFSDNSTQVYSN